MIDVSDTSKYRIESRSINTTTTENTLTVYNVTSSNVGTYTCNATNIIGTDSLPGEITIDGILNCINACVHIFQVVWLVWIIECVTFTFAVMT